MLSHDAVEYVRSAPGDQEDGREHLPEKHGIHSGPLPETGMQLPPGMAEEQETEESQQGKGYGSRAVAPRFHHSRNDRRSHNDRRVPSQNGQQRAQPVK